MVRVQVMATVPRKRNDPRRDATRASLIEAAESMFAEAGVNGVSLRQIGSAVGSLNKTVIAYHFGSKEALLEAVFRHRLPTFEERRRVLLAEIEDADRPYDLETLLSVTWVPLFEQVNRAGQHSYARFLASVFRSGLAHSRQIISPDFPETTRVADMIRALLPPYVAEFRDRRWFIASGIVLSALELIDLEPPGSEPAALRCFEDAIVMAAAALRAPITPNQDGS